MIWIKYNDLINSINRFLLSIYLLFIPFGPLAAFGGINFRHLFFVRLDILAAIVVSILFLLKFSISPIIKKAFPFLIVIFFYFSISTLFSINIKGSFSSLISVLFNIYLLNIFLVLFKSKYDFLAKILISAFFVSTTLVLYSFIISPETHFTSGRFYLILDGIDSEDLVDPNIQASGIVLSLLSNYRYFSFREIRNILISSISIILVLVNLIIFNSRSAFLGLLLGVILLIYKKSKDKNLVFYFILLILLGALFYYFFVNFFDLNIDSLFDKFAASKEDERLGLISDSFKLFTSNDLRVFFGLGLDQTNPHNEILKLLFSLGIVGFFILGILTYFMFKITLNNFVSDKFKFFYFLLFIFLISMFYEHKKLFWVSIILALL